MVRARVGQLLLLLLASVASRALAIVIIDSTRYNVTEELNACLSDYVPFEQCAEQLCPDGQLDTGICYTTGEMPNIGGDNSSSSSSSSSTTTPEVLITPPPGVSITSPTPGPTPTPTPLSLSSSSTSSTTSSSSTVILTPQPEENQFPPEINEEIYVPPALIADEHAVYLTYMANQNQTACMEKAAVFAQSSSQAVRREFARGLNRARKRALIGGSGACLPPTMTVYMAVHWVLPRGATREAWFTPGRRVWDRQMVILREKMKALNFGVAVLGHWVWRDGTKDDASTFSNNYRGEDEARTKRNRKFIEWAKTQTGYTKPYHLHVFIVDAFDAADTPGLNGYCRRPGLSKSGAKSDSCVIKINTLPFRDVAEARGETPAFPGSDEDRNQRTKGRGGMTLPHELGHFFNLRHLHEGGCVSTNDGGFVDGDGVADTEQYGPSESPDYTQTCSGKQVKEANLMSYSSLRTVKDAFTTNEQRIRALAGFMMRRVGFYKIFDDNARNNKQEKEEQNKAERAIAKYFTDQCPFADINVDKYIWSKREVVDDVWHPEDMNKRQLATALTDFCQRTDLVMQSEHPRPLNPF